MSKNIILILTYIFIVFFRCLYKYGLKFTKSSIESIHSLALSTSRCSKYFRNIKDEIILEVFRSKHLQAYEKEYWRLRGDKRLMREDHQNYFFDKRELSYDKPSACRKRWEIFV